MVCRATVFAVVVLATLGGGAAFGQADAPSEDELIKRGLELRRQGKGTQAVDEIKKAYERSHSPRAAAQLGLAEQAVGRWGAADAHLREALAASTDAWVVRNKASLNEAMRVVSARIGQVEVTGEPAGAEIYVDGVLAGRLPLSAPMTVGAGTLDVELRAPGFTASSKKVTLAARGYERVYLRLQPVEAPAPVAAAAAPVVVAAAPAERPVEKAPLPAAVAPAPAPPSAVIVSAPAEPEPPSSTQKTLSWVAFGGAGVFLAGGIVGHIVAEDASARASSLKDTNGAQRCFEKNGKAVGPGGTAPDTDCWVYLDRYQSGRTVAIVGYVGAGVFALTGLILRLTLPDPPSRAANKEIAWTCAPTLGDPGVGCAVRF